MLRLTPEQDEVVNAMAALNSTEVVDVLSFMFDLSVDPKTHRVAFITPFYKVGNSVFTEEQLFTEEQRNPDPSEY